VYYPEKPQKYGIKAYMLCDAVTGYKIPTLYRKSDKPTRKYGVIYEHDEGILWPRLYFIFGQSL
jgi:hypothetical protein